jgi:DNA-directed RNA polymerase subunit RPC12/RpoP
MKNLIAGLQRSSCPKCGSGYLVRSHRKGLEQLVSAFGIFPYRCDACGHRFLSFGERRGRRR